MSRGTDLDNDAVKLVSDFQNGNDTAFNDLCEKYRPLMHAMISRIILSSFPGSAGSENDVYMQEATMALYNAAKTFDCEQNDVTFGLYTKICIRNRLVSVRRKLVGEQKRKKKHIEASKKSKNGKEPKDKEETPHRRNMPANGESLSKLIEENLSGFEKKVFMLYLDNLSYSEIAEALNISVKSVDNALYRIRRKLKKRI